MSTSFPTVDPIKNASQWHKAKLQGVDTPGTIPKGGIKGFLRKTGWDEQKGKGTTGATLVRKSAPPVKGTITLQLFTSQDFANWDSFVATVLSTDQATQAATGISIYYPAFSSIGLTTVVIESYSPPEHVGKGLYHVTLSLIEWSQPPPTSNVSTVATTSADAPDEDVPPPVDPRIAAAQQRVALLTQAAKKP
jgi:hypothetical protein